VLFESAPIIKAGKPDQFPAGTVTLDAQSGIYLINGAKGFYALGAICTHLGCLTAWKPELGIIACPCHGSKFLVHEQDHQRPGDKVEGPAPRPLPWKRIWLNDDGDLLVDRSTDVPPLAQSSFVRV
jgi:cytochrome b6-f complex iron-sulfur subunit